MEYAIPVLEPTTAEIAGTPARFPVHRIYCVGRNYAAHAREMGTDPDREPPFFFMKPSDVVVAHEKEVPYPAETQSFHHEIEMVVAIGKEASHISMEGARDVIYGYAVGNDLTRRDLQTAAKKTGRPWETGKAFEQSALLGSIHPVEKVGHIEQGEISLKINGELRQKGDIRDLIWNVPEVIVELSRLFRLMPGDLIYTGTPDGVGPMERGDELEGYVEGLGVLKNTIV